MQEKQCKKIIINIPIYKDWNSVVKLILQIDSSINELKEYCAIEILLIDDGSGDKRKIFFDKKINNVMNIKILRLSRNMGHQRAIAIGLSYIYTSMDFDAVVVMDGDGEDTTEGLIKLVKRFINQKEHTTVFAKRARRTEGLVFKFLYQLYKLLTWFLTGLRVEVGNFSIIAKEHIACLVVAPELWNHYAASVIKLKLPRVLVPIDRGNRISGNTSMNFVSYVIHGLSAISVFAEEVGVRIIVNCFFLILSLLAVVFTIVAIRFSTDLAFPGWATNVTGMSLILIFQLLIMSLIIVIVMLKNRSSADFIPIRDYHFYIQNEENLELIKESG